MREHDDATASVQPGEALHRIPGAAHKSGEGFGARAIEIGRITPLPVGFHVRHLLFFTGAVVALRLKVMELVDGPFLNWDCGKPPHKRFGGLACTHKWRDEKQGWVTSEVFGERFCLLMAEFCQRIGDVVGWYAACIREALAVANQED